MVGCDTAMVLRAETERRSGQGGPRANRSDPGDRPPPLHRSPCPAVDATGAAIAYSLRPRVRPVTPSCAGSRCRWVGQRDEDRLLPRERGVLTARPDRAGQEGRAGRLPRALDLRPLSPVERRAGPQQLRVVGDRRARAGDVAAGDHRGDLPDRAHPSRDHRPGRRDQRRAARGPLQPRPRQRRGAQRAHPRRSLAGGRHPPRDARGGRRGHPDALAGRAAEPLRPALRGRERARLRPPRDAAQAHRLRLRPEGDQARGADRRRLRHDVSRQGGDRPLSLRRRHRPGPRRHQGLLRPRRGRRARDRPAAVAQRGAAGRAGAGPADAVALRAGVRARHARPPQRAGRP